MLAETWRVLKPAGCAPSKCRIRGLESRGARRPSVCKLTGFRMTSITLRCSLRRILEDNAFVVARCGLDRLPTNDNLWLVVRKGGASRPSSIAARRRGYAESSVSDDDNFAAKVDSSTAPHL